MPCTTVTRLGMHSTARGAGPRRDAGGTGRPPGPASPRLPGASGRPAPPAPRPSSRPRSPHPRGLAARGTERGWHLLNGSPEPAPPPRGCAGAAPSPAGAAGTWKAGGRRLRLPRARRGRSRTTALRTRARGGSYVRAHLCATRQPLLPTHEHTTHCIYTCTRTHTRTLMHTYMYTEVLRTPTGKISETPSRPETTSERS